MSDKKEIMRYRTVWVLFALFMLALILRGVLNVARQELLFHKPFWGSITPTDERTSSDAILYVYAAKGFLEGKGVLSMDNNILYLSGDITRPVHGYIYRKKIDDRYWVHKSIPPVYPLFLAFCYFLGGFNIAAYFIPQLILSSLTCVMIYLITLDFFNSKVALIAGVCVALYPDLIFWTSFARPETLFIFLLVLGFLLLIRGNSRKKTGLLYLSAFIMGLAALTRITLTPFLIFIFIWQVFVYSRNRIEGLKVALKMALIVGVVFLPWGMRNYTVFGKFSVLSDEAGILIGSLENGEQYKNVAINMTYNANDQLLLKIYRFIRDNFTVYLISCWHRFVIFWSPFTHIMRPAAKLYKGFSWFVIFPAAFWGVIVSRKKWSMGEAIIAIFIAYYALLYSLSIMHLNLVYRYPIQPFLCIFAAYAYFDIYLRLRRKMKGSDGK